MYGSAPVVRRTQRGEARDERLRRRAADLFLERGYDGVSIDELIRDVGGSKASVYHFYGDKNGLFTAVMDDMLQDPALPLSRLDLEGLSLAEGLRTFARTLMAILLQPRHLAFQRLVVAEAQRRPAIGLSWYRNGPAATCELLRRFLAAQQGLGHIRPASRPGAGRGAVPRHGRLHLAQPGDDDGRGRADARRRDGDDRAGGAADAGWDCAVK